MAGSSTVNIDSAVSTQEIPPIPDTDDIFLTVQRSTLVVGKIYNELFAKSRTEFISELSNLCSVIELRYVRDMVLALVKRKLSQNHLGPLIERKSGANVKENLLKYIFNVYSLGEGSIQSLPKNMVRSETRYVCQEVQTDSCLSRTLFASKSETEDLKTDLLGKISELREEFAALKNHPLPSNTILDSSVTNPSRSISSMERTQMPASPQDIPPITSTQLVRPTDPGNEADVDSGYPAPDSVNANDVNGKPRKIVITGDSLLHRMNIHKMKVNNISTVKLTKKGDTINGSIARCMNFVGKHSDQLIDVVLLAGTNDLAIRGVNPDDLIDKLDKSLTDLKRFDNVQHVFLCKIPARFDSHNINSKVSHFNELLVERYLDTEDWITVIDTIPPEIRYYYHDGLHMSHLGVTKLCSIVMSNLYKIIAPMSYRKRSHSKSNRRASRR